MHKLRLIAKDGHLFVEMEGSFWIFDTGAPTSFGDERNLTFGNEQFILNSSFLGFSAATLSGYVGVRCSGLLGGDILGNFDHSIDCAQNTLSVSVNELSHNGQCVHCDAFMGIPIVTVRIAGNDYRMIFDTGAQISYFQDESLTNFPFVARFTDFYPGIGQFQTDTYDVPATIGSSAFTLRCGKPPDFLGLAFMMTKTQGIIGNQIMANRVIGYFPRRNIVCL